MAIKPGSTVRIRVQRKVGGGAGALGHIVDYDPEIRNGELRPWRVRPEGCRRVLRFSDEEIESVDVDLGQSLWPC